MAIVIPNDLWTAIVDMVGTNLQSLDQSVKAQKYGQAAHFVSMNDSLFQVLELGATAAVKKATSKLPAKDRLAELKKNH